MSQYFPKPYNPFGGDIYVKVDLSNCATKADLKDATGIDTSNFDDKRIPDTNELVKKQTIILKLLK